MVGGVAGQPRWRGPESDDQVADVWVTVEPCSGHVGGVGDGAEGDGLTGAVEGFDGVASAGNGGLVSIGGGLGNTDTDTRNLIEPSSGFGAATGRSSMREWRGGCSGAHGACGLRLTSR